MGNRHAKPDRCPICCQARFRVSRGHTKPDFTCGNGCSWQSGRDGWPYLEHAENYNGGGSEAWVDYVWRGKHLTPAPQREGE